MFKKQPKIDVKPNETDRKIIKVGWLVILLSAGITLGFYFQLPETIPTHFNHKGEADDFGDRSTLWFLHIFHAALYFLMTLTVTKVKPWNFNYPLKVTEKNAKKVYALGIRMLTVLNLMIATVFAGISLVILQSALIGNSPGVWLIILIFVPVFLPLIYYSFKMFKVPK